MSLSSPPRSATARDETPVYVRAGAENIFGVLTRPVVEPNGTAVLFLGPAQTMSSHRNALWTSLAREVAGLGCLGFRMDYHGTGDSSGVLADRSVDGQTAVDVDCVVEWLVALGARHVILVSTCWGGLVALTAAARMHPIHAMCLVSPPLRFLEFGADASTRERAIEVPAQQAVFQFLQVRALGRLLFNRRYRGWVLRRARLRMRRTIVRARSIGRLTRGGGRESASPAELVLPVLRQRGVCVRVLFGAEESSYRDLVKPGALPVIQSHRDLFDVATSPVALHAVATLAAQRFVRDDVIRWVSDLCAAASTGAASAPPPPAARS